MNSLTSVLPESLIEAFVAAGRAQDIPALGEAISKAAARFMHPDRTSELEDDARGVLREAFAQLNLSVEDLKDKDGLSLAISGWNTPSRRAQLSAKADAESELRSAKATSRALIGLLPNIDQMSVMGIDKPTTFLLAYATSRLILDIRSSGESILSSTTVSDDAIPLSGGRGSCWYNDRGWTESGQRLEVDGDDSAKASTRTVRHDRSTIGAVTVVGFVPEVHFTKVADPDAYLAETLQQLHRGRERGHDRLSIGMTPAQSAWFIDKIEPSYTPGSRIAAMDTSGRIALISDAILAQADLGK